METTEQKCCETSTSIKKQLGLRTGIVYGLLPHLFCIAIIFLPIIGVVSASAIIGQLLQIPYFVPTLIIFSIILTTLSAMIYLKKKDCLCLSGAKDNWKYLSMLYLAVILTNIFMSLWAIPFLAKISVDNTENSKMAISTSTPPICH